MNLLEAFEELNLINESTDLTEAKSASDLRPIRKANFDAWYRLLAPKQAKLEKDLNNILKGINVKDSSNGKSGIMDGFGITKTQNETALEVVARINAVRVPATKGHTDKYNYILDDGTNPAAKQYSISVYKLGSVIQPEPTTQASWQDVVFKVRFKQRVFWDGSSQSELADYFSRYIKTEHTTTPVSKIYVLDETAAEKANAVIKEFNNEISADVLQSDYWKTYKSNWLAEQLQNKKRVLVGLKKQAKTNWNSLSKQEQEAVIDDAKVRQKAAANTNSEAASVIQQIKAVDAAQSEEAEHNLWYTIGWLAKHIKKLTFSCPIHAVEIWQNVLGDTGKDRIVNIKPADYKDDWNYSELTNGSIILDTSATSNPVVGHTLQSWIDIANSQKLKGETKTNPLTADQKEVKSWRIVKDLVTQFGFQLSPYQQETDVDGDPITTTYQAIKQDISKIVPSQDKQKEAFDDGYNA